MTADTATTLTDVVLAAGTFALGLKVQPCRGQRTWSAFFILLAVAAASGAVYHGTVRFHTHEFWTLVATTSTSSAFMFFAACACVAKPSWKWLTWTWPIFAVVGLLVGGLLAPAPFWYISVAAGVCMLMALLILPYAPSKKARNWIYAGVAASICGLLAQRFVSGDGLLSHDAVFHELQLIGNFLIWKGAKNS
jgi:hypothetical protein